MGACEQPHGYKGKNGKAAHDGDTECHGAGKSAGGEQWRRLGDTRTSTWEGGVQRPGMVLGVPVRMEEIREDRERSGANRGKLRAGEEVNSNLQWCEGCKRWVAEKKLGIEETQQIVVIVGGRGLWEGGLDQGVWVQGGKVQQWFQTVGALVWKENGERRRAKARKLNGGEGRGGGHFTALRFVHCVWWDCDDGSVKQYIAGADEREEEEIRAVVLQKMQNANRIARDGGEIITLEAGQREVERGGAKRLMKGGT